MAYWEPDGFIQLGKGDYVEVTTDEVFQKIREATGIQDFFTLADFLDARAAFLSDAKRRNIIPVAWLEKAGVTIH